MALSNVKVSLVKPEAKAYKLIDDEGIVLLVQSNGPNIGGGQGTQG